MKKILIAGAACLAAGAAIAQIPTTDMMLVPAQAPAEVAEDAPQVLALRSGVSWNGINYNGIGLNGINYNGINYNGIGLNGIRINGINYNSIEATTPPVNVLLKQLSDGKLAK